MVLRSRGYRQVSLPVSLIEPIEEYIKSHAEEGYTSVPDFIKEIIKEKLGLNTKSNQIKIVCKRCKAIIHNISLPTYCHNCHQPINSILTGESFNLVSTRVVEGE